jgi:outer membrane protein assembly factor BamB
MRCVITRPHDLMTGDVQWTAEQRGMWGWLVPAGDVLVLGGWRGYTPVVALDVMTGKQRWKLDLCSNIGRASRR